jgi:hypothetical protein
MDPQHLASGVQLTAKAEIDLIAEADTEPGDHSLFTSSLAVFTDILAQVCIPFGDAAPFPAAAVISSPSTFSPTVAAVASAVSDDASVPEASQVGDFGNNNSTLRMRRDLRTKRRSWREVELKNMK